MGVNQRNFWRQLFSTNGVGGGTTDMAAAADEYFIFPAAGDLNLVEKIKIVVEDDGDLPNDEFAAMGSALANGIIFKLIQGEITSYDVFTDYLGALTLKQNSDFVALGNTTYSIDVTGVSVLVCEIDFTKEFGFPIFLDGDNNFGLLFKTQDDMSTLERMYVIASGVAKDAYR
jgi:hypothetical protein